MNTSESQPNRAKSIFFRALDVRDGPLRKSSLNAACQGDDALRGEIEKLLQVERADDDLLAQAVELLKLHLIAGLSVAEAGRTLGMSRKVAYRNWGFIPTFCTSWPT